MKLFRFSITLLLLLVIAMAKAEPQFLETFKPLERTHDFGKIYEKDGKVETIFTFKNTGNKVVAISDVNTWCGCMAVDYTKKAIRPGETASLKVSVDPDHKEGNFVKQVVLLLNDGKNYVRVWVKAQIVPMQHPVQEDCPYNYGHGLFMDKQIFPIPNYPVGKDFQMSIAMGNNTQKPMTITFLRQPNNTVLKLPQTVQLQPGEVKKISVSYHFYRTHQRDSHILLTPVVNGKPARPLKVKWNGNKKFKLLN